VCVCVCVCLEDLQSVCNGLLVALVAKIETENHLNWTSV